MNARGRYGFAWLALLWIAGAASPAAAILPRFLTGTLVCPAGGLSAGNCSLTGTFSPSGSSITTTTVATGDFLMGCPSAVVGTPIAVLTISSSGTSGCCPDVWSFTSLPATTCDLRGGVPLGNLVCSTPCAAQVAPPFRDVMRGSDITVGPGLHGGTGPPLINFTGSAGSARGTWLTVFDETPDTPDQTIFTGSVTLGADVRIHTFNNKKGAGLVALFNEGAGQKGLVLILYDNGNTDSLVLATVDQAGKLTVLRSVALGAGVLENAWYHLTMDVIVSGNDLTVTGSVFRHTDPNDPDSGPGTPAVGTLSTPTPLSLAALGLQGSGEVGVVATSISAVVDSSVTNFEVSQD